MKTLKVLRQRPALFFRLSGIRVADFDDLVKATYPLWQTRERKRLSCKGRQRAIGAGMKYRLDFAAQLLMCLIYYRPYTSHVFLGLVFGVSSPTVCRRRRDMTRLLAGHFHLPERKIKLSEADKDNLLYLMVDGTERPVHRSKKPGKRKRSYSGKKKRHTAVHQIITDNNKRILAVGPAQEGRKHDKRIFDESRMIKPPDIMVPIARMRHPIVEPRERYETEGFFGGVVFCCGAVIRDDVLNIYYGAADDVMALATIPLKEVWQHLSV